MNAQTILELFSCDTSIECVGFECGIGVCGGTCPNTCKENEKCETNTCTCPPPFIKDLDKCVDCQSFPFCVACTNSKCTRCETNYHLVEGKCLVNTFENPSKYPENIAIQFEDNVEQPLHTSEPSIQNLNKVFQEFADSSVIEDLKGAYHYDESVENGSTILCTCFVLNISMLFLVF